MTLRATAGASPFAHLLGLGRASAKSKAETEEDRKEDERDEKEAAAAETEGEEDRREEDEKPEGKKAAGKKAAAETEGDDDEEDEEEMRGKSAAADARRRERARCEAIFASSAAAGQPHVAAQLAFGTTMGAKAAIKLMETTTLNAAAPAPKRSSLDERMAAHRTPVIGSGPAAAKPAAGQPGSAAASAIAAYRKALGKAD